MKTHQVIGAGLLLALLSGPGIAAAASSAQDSDLTVAPVVRVFPATTPVTGSASLTFTVTNHNATVLKTLNDPPTLDGPNFDQFTVESRTCTGSLNPASSCTVTVKFQPDSSGAKGANLRITPTLAAFVTNSEAVADEALRRIPPVLTAVSIPETMTAGSSQGLTWSLEGYGSGYLTRIVFFDCTGISDGSCGDYYGDSTRFYDSGNLSAGSTGPGNWEYNGITDLTYNYSLTFNVPAKRADGSDWATGGTDVVVRFFVKDDIDAARNNPTISLVIPGNLSGTYYDKSGRRIVKKIAP